MLRATSEIAVASSVWSVLVRSRVPAISRARWRAVTTSASVSIGCSDPGTTGTLAAIIRRRASTLSPMASMASGDGPMKVSPASRTARANGARSERKP